MRALLLALLALGCATAVRASATGVDGGDQALQRGVDRAITWLTPAVDSQWRPDMAAMAQYLARKFPDPRLAQLAGAARARFQTTTVDTQEFPPPFFRLVDPTAVTNANAIAAIPGRIGRITAAALHCDHLALPPTYLAELDGLAQRGGYSLTHALIAAQWLEENHCPAGDEVERFRTTWIPRLAALVDAPKIPDDLRIEAIATLAYVGARPRLRPVWIDWVLKSQRGDGGWGLTQDRADSHPHPTFLALWVLLEALDPAPPAVPMIPKTPADDPRRS